MLTEFHGRVEEAENRELEEGALLVDGVHHADVQRGRVVEAANGVVEEDVGVFEEPGDQEQG